MEAVAGENLLSMVLNSGAVVLGVLIILLLLSIWSWTITIAKLLQLRKAKADSDEFSSIFWKSRNLANIDDSSRRFTASPLAQVFTSGYRELGQLLQERQQSERVDRQGELGVLEMALKRAEFEQGLKLERGITFLATVASAAPFIGLFGTVWGIMDAFRGLSTAQSSTIQSVAPGISEALVATAIGLAAAIPAAVAYNYFAVAVRNFKQSMERFSSEFLSIAQRYFVN